MYNDKIFHVSMLIGIVFTLLALEENIDISSPILFLKLTNETRKSPVRVMPSSHPGLEIY